MEWNPKKGDDASPTVLVRQVVTPPTDLAAAMKTIAAMGAIEKKEAVDGGYLVVARRPHRDYAIYRTLAKWNG